LTEAEEIFRFVLDIGERLNQGPTAAKNNLGLVRLLQYRQGDTKTLDEAINWIGQSIAEGGTYHSFLRLGVAHHLKGEYAKRDACFEEGIRWMRDRFDQNHYFFGREFFELGRILSLYEQIGAASPCFERAIGLLDLASGTEGERLLQKAREAIQRIQITPAV